MDSIDSPLSHRLHAFVQSHRVYMREFGSVEDGRSFHGANPAALRVMDYLGEWDVSTVGQVANNARLSPSNASHVLSDLRRRGFASCDVDGSDRRHRLYGLTPEGRRVSGAWNRHVEGAIARIVFRWPMEKQHAVGAQMVELSRLLGSFDW